MMCKRFTNKVVIVTGAAYGIGRATALRFAKEGARLFITDVDTNKLADTCKILDELRAEYVCEAFDIRSEEKIDNMVATIMDKWGQIDVLCNVAGVGQFNPFPTTCVDEWDFIMDINAKALYLTCRAVVPIMMDQEQRGNIVNVTSIMGEFAGIAQSIYNTSKGAAKMLTQAIAKDMGLEGIRCNAVAPGMITTGLTETMFADEEKKAWFEEKIPLGHVGEPDDIAAAICFLASDDAKFITGATLKVDGGMTCATN